MLLPEKWPILDHLLTDKRRTRVWSLALHSGCGCSPGGGRGRGGSGGRWLQSPAPPSSDSWWRMEEIQDSWGTGGWPALASSGGHTPCACTGWARSCRAGPWWCWEDRTSRRSDPTQAGRSRGHRADTTSHCTSSSYQPRMDLNWMEYIIYFDISVKHCMTVHDTVLLCNFSDISTVSTDSLDFPPISCLLLLFSKLSFTKMSIFCQPTASWLKIRYYFTFQGFVLVFTQDYLRGNLNKNNNKTFYETCSRVDIFSFRRLGSWCCCWCCLTFIL